MSTGSVPRRQGSKRNSKVLSSGSPKYPRGLRDPSRESSLIGVLAGSGAGASFAPLREPSAAGVGAAPLERIMEQSMTAAGGKDKRSSDSEFLINKTDNLNAPSPGALFYGGEESDDRQMDLVETGSAAESRERRRRRTKCICCCCGCCLCVWLTALTIATAVCLGICLTQYWHRSHRHSRQQAVRLTREDEMIVRQAVDGINQNPTSVWKAAFNPTARFGQNRHLIADSNVANFHLVDARLADRMQNHSVIRHRFLLGAARLRFMPAEFDARREWPQCAGIDQALAAASTIGDKICVATGGRLQLQVSAQDLVECCELCGKCAHDAAAVHSFVHWQNRALVTGGAHGSYVGCKPFELQPDCAAPCRSRAQPLDTCRAYCTNHAYETGYVEDRVPGPYSIYWLRHPGSPQSTQEFIDLTKREIYDNGPVTACFQLPKDFTIYDSGVFLTADVDMFEWQRCGKLIGWGQFSNGVHQGASSEYWIAVNTWGPAWGSHGMFRISMDLLPHEVVGATVNLADTNRV